MFDLCHTNSQAHISSCVELLETTRSRSLQILWNVTEFSYEQINLIRKKPCFHNEITLTQLPGDTQSHPHLGRSYCNLPTTRYLLPDWQTSDPSYWVYVIGTENSLLSCFQFQALAGCFPGPQKRDYLNIHASFFLIQSYKNSRTHVKIPCHFYSDRLLGGKPLLFFGVSKSFPSVLPVLSLYSYLCSEGNCGL